MEEKIELTKTQILDLITSGWNAALDYGGSIVTKKIVNQIVNGVFEKEIKKIEAV